MNASYGNPVFWDAYSIQPEMVCDLQSTVEAQYLDNGGHFRLQRIAENYLGHLLGHVSECPE